MSATEKKKVKAEFEACWAGDFVYVCEQHMKKLMSIGSAMGCPVNCKPYNGDRTCKNCENEK